MHLNVTINQIAPSLTSIFVPSGNRLPPHPPASSRPQVSVAWQCIVDGRDVLPEWQAAGAAAVTDGPALTLRAGHAGRPARVVLAVTLPTSPTALEFSTAITFAPPRPVEVAVAPAAGVALSTVFEVAVGGCAAGESFAFRVGDGQEQRDLEVNTRCGLTTMLPGAARAVIACRGTTDGAPCDSAPVTVRPRALDASEVAAAVESWGELPVQELAQQAAVYMAAVNALPPGNERSVVSPSRGSF